MNRKTFLSTTAAAAPGAMLCGALAGAGTMAATTNASAASRRLIDVHHHLEPNAKNNDGNAWSIQAAVEELDLNAVSTAIGYSGPIFDTDVPAGRKRAREINEWSTKVGMDHPGRFGLFASLPMNDVEGSLAEIAYAFDVLKADGIGLATNYQGAWLGDPKFRPIFQELNRRKAVVYVHPAQAPCCTPATLSYETGVISAPWIEFPTNTARTILSLWASGTTQQFPDIKFIFVHGGGVMPLLLGRFAGFTDWRSVGPEKLKTVFPNGVYPEFAKLYFECAQAYAPETMAMLRGLVPPSHLLFGTDYSYFPIAHAVDQFAQLKLPDNARQMIRSENAAALLPRWKA